MVLCLKQLSLLISLLSTLNAADAFPSSKESRDYDMIVVGAGAGGIVAATKFAESGLKTLLLEAGGPMLYRDGNREIPEWTLEPYPNNTVTRHDSMAFYTSNYPGSPNATAYYCTNLPSGQLAACMLGGGTSVNAEQQFWPPAHYLDAAYGFEGWTSFDFQPAIQRVAARIVPTPYWSADNKFYYDEVYPLISSVMDNMGMTEVNTTANGDAKYNTYGRDVYAAKDGLRGGPLVGYLQDAKKLPNFTLKMFSVVESLKRTGSRITGVKVNGTTITAKNVVLSAGVWNTPSILFASGIGPKSELSTAASINFTSHGKKTWIINEAVGKNLHDNPQTNIQLTYNDSAALPFYSSSGMLAGVNVSKSDSDMLYYNHSGPLTNTGRQLVGWITVDDKQSKNPTPMTVQTICSTPTSVNGSFSCQFNLNEGLLSRGAITLGTDGNMAFADGVGPWLTDSHDIKMYAKAMDRFVTAALAYPGLNVTSPPAGDLASYETYLSTNAKRSNNHWGGSCSLNSCVDLNAKVFGTDNLFVIDGSLSPAPTSSNPSFLYEVLGEMASEKIIRLLQL